MQREGRVLIQILAAGILLSVLGAPGHGAGFGFFEQASRAMGMGGAFTAQADDGSAMFHNVAGLAFQKGERRFSAGTTLVTNITADFQGVSPFPGPGATAEQQDQIFFPSHFYWVEPLGKGPWTFGLGVNSPFGLSTAWEDDFEGRFISLRAELRTFDFNPSLGVQLTENLGVGFGAIGRFADVELLRRIPLADPFTGAAVDVSSLLLESDLDEGFGFNVGILHKAASRFTWGLSYRSQVEVDLGGDGRFSQIATGNPQVDAAAASVLPFGQELPVETSIDFPDMASLGLAFALSERSLLEVDVNWTGWSNFEKVVIDFTSASEFDTTLPQNWEDVYNYRLGWRHTTRGGNEWRLGLIYDETPQPDPAVSPLLPDADRVDVTVGYGFRISEVTTDIALMYVDFDERTTRSNDDNFNGSYKTEAVLLGLTVSW